MITELAQIQNVCILRGLPAGGVSLTFPVNGKSATHFVFSKRIGVVRSLKLCHLFRSEFTAPFLGSMMRPPGHGDCPKELHA